MSGQLATEHLKFIKAKCNAENLTAFVSEIGGAVAPATCSNCGGDGIIDITFSRAGAGSPSMWRSGIRYQVIDHASFPCPMCKADNSQRTSLMLKQCGVPDHEWDWNIHHIQNMPGKEDAYRIACEILAMCPMPIGFNLIYGDYGMGKSGLMKGLVVSLIKAGVSSLYITASDILSQIRATFQRNSQESELDILNDLIHARFLAIDEVDIIGSTEWSLSTFRTLIDKRYESRSINCTILATNRAPDQLWPYLASRCEDGCRIQIGGDSLRGAKPDKMEYLQF